MSDRREAGRRVQDLQKQLRSERSRSQEAEQRAAREDPTASERSFLLGVRLAYARDFGEGDRLAYPLGRMRVGRSFLGTLPTLDRVPLEKLLEVCAQVGSGRAHEIPGRSVHPFRTSEQGGAPYRVRARDDAKAWRCSLVDQTAGAPRLHWWSVPGPDGATVEFASVNHHEDFSLPE